MILYSIETSSNFFFCWCRCCVHVTTTHASCLLKNLYKSQEYTERAHQFKMKFFIILISVLGVVKSALISTNYVVNYQLEDKFRRCRTLTGVTPETSRKVRSHDFSFFDEAGKCFALCMCQTTGFCNENLEIVTTEFEKRATVEVELVRKIKTELARVKPDFFFQIHKVRDFCNGLETFKSNPCDLIYLRFSCYFAQIPDPPKRRYLYIRNE